jgi:hypothetical protein
MKFIQTATKFDTILEAHAYHTGRDFYAGYENVLKEHAEFYSDINEWFLGDDEKVYFIFNYDRGNGIVEPILNELTIHSSISAGVMELVILHDDGTHTAIGYGADKGDRKGRAMLQSMCKQLAEVGRKVVMASQPQFSITKYNHMGDEYKAEVFCMKSMWKQRQKLIDFYAVKQTANTCPTITPEEVA